MRWGGKGGLVTFNQTGVGSICSLPIDKDIDVVLEDLLHLVLHLLLLS